MSTGEPNRRSFITAPLPPNGRTTTYTERQHMSGDYFYGGGPKGAPKRSGRPSQHDPRGRPATGRIAKILIGQGHGFIRLRDDREIFFHRSDLREGTAFNDLQIGDAVTFELLEDSVSGARALRVKRNKSGR
jgi:cold shock CspA family protein